MPNPFDQFDTPSAGPAKPAASANPFDQFDQPAPAQERGVFDKLTGQTGPRYQLWPERAVRSIGEGLMAGPKLMGDVMQGRVDPTSKEAIGRSFEAATASTPLSPARGTARMIFPPSKAAKVEAPAQEELFESASSRYKDLKSKNVPLADHVADDLSNKVKTRLNEDFHPDDQIKTYRAVEGLKAPAGPASASEVYKVRTRLNNIIGDHPGTSEAKAAKIAIDHIDEYLSNVPQFGEVAKAARGDYRAASHSRDLSESTYKGRLEADSSGSGANVANKLRASVRKLLVDKTWRKTPEETELMEAIVRGGNAENVARLVSKLGPKHPLSGWGPAIAADLHGAGGIASAGVGIGHLAQWLSERAPQKKIDALDEMIRANSPLGQERVKAGPPPKFRFPYGVPPKGTAAFPAAAGALSPADNQDALAPDGGSALAKPVGVLGPRSDLGGQVMSDASPDPIRPGQQYASMLKNQPPMGPEGPGGGGGADVPGGGIGLPKSYRIGADGSVQKPFTAAQKKQRQDQLNADRNIAQDKLPDYRSPVQSGGEGIGLPKSAAMSTEARMQSLEGSSVAELKKILTSEFDQIPVGNSKADYLSQIKQALIRDARFLNKIKP